MIGAEFVRDGCELAIAEMLRGGTTCLQRKLFFPRSDRRDLPAAWVSARWSGLPVIEFPTAWAVKRRTNISSARSRCTTNSRAIRW